MRAAPPARAGGHHRLLGPADAVEASSVARRLVHAAQQRPRRRRRARARLGWAGLATTAPAPADWASTSARIAPAAARCPWRKGSLARRTKSCAAGMYERELIATLANATPVARRSSCTFPSTGSAQGSSPSSRGGNASKTTNPTFGS